MTDARIRRDEVIKNAAGKNSEVHPADYYRHPNCQSLLTLPQRHQVIEN
jgi:hypothetical protein